MQNDKLFISKFIKRNGKIEFLKKEDLDLFNKLSEEMRPGQVIDFTADFSSDNGKLGQIAKLKAGIRDIARKSGAAFIDVQNEIKTRAGLYDEMRDEFKSFGDASVDELSDSISAMMELSAFVGLKDEPH